ncbi:hypothetical protein FNT36_22235 [Hymenobacter setariae]|uniref:Uncharacterized protein n=1 Tax=Hymenobacter setariae TaxID=2594794 RepID=A0A558BMZ3_9BACT|nr:hypothetical protein [Hymenobacter setariae]TVT37881.1 hypothetical protein FNT36_22235 [Hymenobacter setariae]
MQDNYSLAKCEQYGRRLASRLCQQHFGPQPDATLDGPALLKFTPIRQLNLLVVRQLLGRWQHEAQQLRSPYFNFEAEAVRTALTQFMNVLSRHIRLDRAALEPLLAQAAADTLLLAADPALAFERLLLPAASADADEPVPVTELRDALRYLDQDKEYYQAFVDSLPSSNAPLSRDFLVQRFALYQAKHTKAVDAMPRLVAAFSALLPLTEADLWDDGPATPAPTPASEPVATPAPAPAPAPTPVASPPAPASAEPSTPPAPESPAPAAPPAEEPAPTNAVPLYEKLKATQPTAASPLASTLRHSAQGGASPLAERSAPKVGSLREAISINQRFSFINELFNGENMEYHAAIQHLDSLPTADAAMAYVRQELANSHDWSRKEEHVGKLLKLIERKFATT